MSDQQPDPAEHLRLSLELVRALASRDPDHHSPVAFREDVGALAIVAVDLDNRFADLADSLEKVEHALARLILERKAGESRLAELEAAVAWLRESRSE